jgi:hypothetical protein
MAIARKEAPRVAAWVGIVEDLSGLEPTPADWIAANAIPATLRDFLKEAGRTYVPVMRANAHALATGADRVETEIDGKPWVQQPFPYQGKCLRWLREAYDALAEADRRTVNSILDGTGCEPLVAD